uniref:Uncharacterized protein n=2 Tax=Triticinae TaxID=1648030 RepID=A0A453AQX3_AEGTS
SQQRRARSTLPSRPYRRPIKPQAQMAQTAAVTPAPAPPPATRPKLSGGLEPLDARIKELTSSQGELLARIQKLKQDVQKWRSNVEAQVKTCHNELVEVKEGLASEVQHLKSVCPLSVDLFTAFGALCILETFQAHIVLFVASRTSRKSDLLSRKRRQARKRSKPGRHKTRYSRLMMNRPSNKLRCKHEICGPRFKQNLWMFNLLLWTTQKK